MNTSSAYPATAERSCDEAESEPPSKSPLPAQTRAFKDRHYPYVSDEDWNNWRWQIKNRVSTLADIQRFLTLDPQETAALLHPGSSFPFAITPYYLSIAASNEAVRRTVIPTVSEYDVSPDEADDPLHEDTCSPVPGLVHRYPNRVLFLVTDFCSTCCRYCTRSRLIGSVHRENCRNNWDAAIQYIERTPEIEDVLLSGGDPLTLPTATLERLLERLSRIPHVRFLRIGTKVPVVLPQRITKELTGMLKRYHPLFVSIHFTHPAELIPEARRACQMLSNAGIPLGSQTVLLKGVNDSVSVMRDLMMGLLSTQVRPYYLYQCDPICGSGHFRTPVAKGLEVIRGLRGFISGYAVPTYVVDAPGGGGKIPLIPDYYQGREGNVVHLKNYAGKDYYYPDNRAG